MSDVSKKLQDILSGSGKNISSAINSSELEKFKGKLSQADKQKILNTFSGMNVDEIKKKLSNADLGAISNMSADKIIEKLKKL